MAPIAATWPTQNRNDHFNRLACDCASPTAVSLRTLENSAAISLRTPANCVAISLRTAANSFAMSTRTGGKLLRHVDAQRADLLGKPPLEPLSGYGEHVVLPLTACVVDHHLKLRHAVIAKLLPERTNR